jgi:hypothetical protein
MTNLEADFPAIAVNNVKNLPAFQLLNVAAPCSACAVLGTY